MRRIVATIATDASHFVEILETDVAKRERYAFPMLQDMLQEWVKQALQFANMSQAGLGRELTASLKRNIDRAAVNKMTTGAREVAADELIQIARITGFPAPIEEPEPPPVFPPDIEDIDTVPLVGYVGAGSLFFPFPGGQPIDRVKAPEGANDRTVSVRIRGDSLGMLFDQWLIFYDEVRDPPTRDLLNQLCIVGLEDESILVKKLTRGQRKNRFTLRSNDPPMYDVVVRWAARVKQMSPR